MVGRGGGHVTDTLPREVTGHVRGGGTVENVLPSEQVYS